ncbi:hypothetical protein [Gelria sp. Kuro-4]|uniref:hypothetical protein n=1 Tax=Gelria sp. Kuro-4 TaxID=2796927 RepID=UPI001BEE5969|nr:hypothetical protein [Gelria sp. Kuro-4]BCV23311.1 hypothetical protein kuro4_00840 [Gelria sp. Kuro-4]
MLLAFDPGKTTGFAWFDEDRFKVSGAGQVVMDVVPKLLKTFPRPKTILLEAFRVYPWKSAGLVWDNLPAPQVIGMIRSWADECNVPIIELPASVRKTITNDVLKAFKAWDMTAGMPHARDATRHLLWYCRKEFPERFIEVLKERGSGVGTRERHSA